MSTPQEQQEERFEHFLGNLLRAGVLLGLEMIYNALSGNL